MTNSSKSRNVALQVYPHWDVEPPPLPSHSRLFRLEPIGIGTPEVECLTSYASRLASEHCLSPRKLLFKEILSPAGKHTVHYSTSSKFSASLINGMGRLADLTIRTLERLTLRDDLRHTTMITWEDVISTHLLLRTQKAWCSTCYEEQFNEGKPIYDHLIWAFKIVAFCPRHHTPLCQTCPYCSSNLPFISTSSYPGFCSKCRQWLGVSGGNAPVVSKKNVWQISEAHLIGELLSCTVNFDTPPASHDFITNLAEYVDERARSNINLFSDLVNIWSGTVRRLLVGETKLSLNMLYQLCSRLNVSPRNLLSCRGEDMIQGKHRLTVKRVIPCVSNNAEPEKTLPVKGKHLRAKEVTPWVEIEKTLRSALLETPPPSVEKVARRMGYYPTRITKSFPDQCKQIASRYWKYISNKHPHPAKVRKVLQAAIREIPPPSLQSVLRSLSCHDTGSYYYRNYQDLCFAISKNYLRHRNKPFDKDIDGKRLQEILTEYPPPSFSEVSKRLGHTREFLRRKFPELSKTVISRYLYHLSALRKEKAERLRHAIRVAIRQVVASGQYVSEARVKEKVRQQLPNLGRGANFKLALRDVKLELGLSK